MIEENIVIKEWIDEAKTELDKYVKDVINNKGKIHINAPVGTGKTSYAIDIIKKYQDEYQFLLLEPQISISEQVKVKMHKDNVHLFIYNSDTRNELKRWEIKNQMPWGETYISTIDSAWRLFEDGKLDPDKTIIIVDESHSFLQSARKDFDKTVRAILSSGCPVIGFTATISNWVLDYVFQIQKHIIIEATYISNKIIVPFELKQIPSTIAQVIESESYTKTIIFTENKKEQLKIKEAIVDKIPSLKVIIFNADTREKEEKKAWEYLMKNDKLPQGTNVAIINMVAQAGININDNDIDKVWLVDKFDPLGFQQYLGRCRYYKGVFDFLYLNYGESKTDWKNPKSLEQWLDGMQQDLDKLDPEHISTLRNIEPSLKELYAEKPDGSGFELNRCMAASKIFSKFRELHGEKLIDFLKNVAPNIEFEDNHEYTDIVNTNQAQRKAAVRKNHKDKLLDMIRKNASYLNELIQFIEPAYNHNDAIDIINDSTPNKKEAKKDGLLYVPKTRVKSLLQTIETSKKAGDTSLVRVLLASKYYKSSGKDLKVLNKILNTMAISTIKKHLKAHVFFDNDYANTPLLKKVLNDLKGEIGLVETSIEWKELINTYTESHLRVNRGIIDIDTLVNKIFNYCLIMNKVKVQVSGIRKNKLKLESVVDNYNDYRIGKGLDKIFR